MGTTMVYRAAAAFHSRVLATKANYSLNLLMLGEYSRNTWLYLHIKVRKNRCKPVTKSM
jgi:hypothetical protein